MRMVVLIVLLSSGCAALTQSPPNYREAIMTLGENALLQLVPFPLNAIDLLFHLEWENLDTTGE